jgi:hypothetical protein
MEVCLIARVGNDVAASIAVSEVKPKTHGQNAARILVVIGKGE